MRSHTPGPWVASKRRPGDWDIETNDADIAEVHGFGYSDEGESDANARLIAAAPEQHAALLPIAMFPLEDFAQYDDCADMRVIFKANDWSLTVGDIRRARAAIAKATGATP